MRKKKKSEEIIVYLEGCKETKDGIRYITYPTKDRITSGLGAFILLFLFFYSWSISIVNMIWRIEWYSIPIYYVLGIIIGAFIIAEGNFSKVFYKAEIEDDILRIRKYFVTEEISCYEMKKYKDDKDFFIDISHIDLFLKVGIDKYITFSTELFESFSLLAIVLDEKLKIENPALIIKNGYIEMETEWFDENIKNKKHRIIKIFFYIAKILIIFGLPILFLKVEHNDIVLDLFLYLFFIEIITEMWIESFFDERIKKKYRREENIIYYMNQKKERRQALFAIFYLVLLFIGSNLILIIALLKKVF